MTFEMQETRAASLPTALTEITPEWLTTALSEYAPGTRVVSANLGEPIHGTATNVRVTLEYAPRAVGQDSQHL